MFIAGSYFRVNNVRVYVLNNMTQTRAGHIHFISSFINLKYFGQHIASYKQIVIIILLWLIPALIAGQGLKGKVLSAETGEPVAWANVVIAGRNTGTVSDASGNFSFPITEAGVNDSVKFYMIGYESRILPLSQFSEVKINNIYLKPVVYNLHEVIVPYSKPRETIIGTEVLANDLRSGFGYNEPGSELGVRIRLKKPVRLEDINLNIGVCTYDSVTYRLNIYQADNQQVYRNVLREPVYFSFSGENIDEAITLNLRKYSIVVNGNIIIALELYRDLGEGRLLFRTSLYGGNTSHRKSIDSPWTDSPGVIGIYLHGQVIR